MHAKAGKCVNLLLQDYYIKFFLVSYPSWEQILHQSSFKLVKWIIGCVDRISSIPIRFPSIPCRVHRIPSRVQSIPCWGIWIPRILACWIQWIPFQSGANNTFSLIHFIIKINEIQTKRFFLLISLQNEIKVKIFRS